MTHHHLYLSLPLRAVFQSIFVLALLGAEIARAQEHNNSSDAINALNIMFRSEYADARSSQLAQAGPVILVRGDFLILIRGDEHIQGSTIHANYHDLKAVSHGPLALYCITSNCLGKPLNEDRRTRLKALAKALKAMVDDLENAFDDPGQRARQIEITSGCVEFVDSVLQNGTCDAEQLDDLVDRLRPELVLNAAEAARMRIDNYHAQMKRWHEELTGAEWQQIHVIIPGAATPRQNSLAVRYFAKLFEQPGEGNRVIYAESQFDESQALRLLGTHLLDGGIGKAFFDDSSRMKRDLLGPFANAYLDVLDFESLHER